MSSKKRKLSIKDKFDIINKFNDGVSRKKLMSDYNLKDYSHLTHIFKKKEEILQKYNQLNEKSTVNSYTLKKSKYPEVEKALVEWMKQMRGKKINLSSDVILKKASEFAKLLKINDFEPTFGYLNGLKKRQNLVFTVKHGESESVDETIVQKWSLDLKEKIKEYKPENVYNLDETALFWRLLPSKTYAFTDESSYGNKKSKERITVVVITNADGSDRTCVMIGKSVRPLAFRGINHFPIDYYHQKNSWINSEIYRKILVKLNLKFKKSNRNILLFVDNCRTHLEKIDLSNITVEFFPPNTTSKLQVLNDHYF